MTRHEALVASLKYWPLWTVNFERQELGQIMELYHVPWRNQNLHQILRRSSYFKFEK